MICCLRPLDQQGSSYITNNTHSSRKKDQLEKNTFICDKHDVNKNTTEKRTQDNKENVGQEQLAK